jgi:eukaryotic-like serine/threonine-protein kinase
MPSGPETVPLPGADDWLALKDVVTRFESAWRQGHRPAVDDYLLTGDVLRPQILIELVHVELELRLKAGEAARAEEYIARYPELASDRSAVLNVIAAEYELRRRREPGLELDEFRKRFPEYQAQLPEQVAQSTIGGEDWPLRRPVSSPEVAPPEISGYEVVSLLGQGGMGAVYKARHIHLNRIVALKTIIGGVFAVPSERDRFRREAEAIAHLDHPNIVPVYEVGEASGVPYFSMKYYAGGSLADHGRIPASEPRKTARLVESTARAIHHAHQRGVLHRDLKPSNVLLDEVGQPYVADFGLAKRFDPGIGPTEVSTVAGTPAYMAPEQAAGRTELTTAADVYGLGVILYELLAGAPPFEGDSPLAVLKKLQEESPAKLTTRNPRVPRDLETIAFKCLEKDPRRRYESAQELADDLARYQAGRPIVARPIRSWERAWRGVCRHPVIAGFAAVGLVAVGLFVATLVISNRRIGSALNEEREARAALSEALDREQRHLYFERIGSAHRFWSSNQTVRAGQLLDLCPPHLRQWEWYYLDRLRQPNCFNLSGHGAEVLCVATSADGRWFATGDRDGVVRLWDCATRAAVRTWPTNDSVFRLAFSPDGAHLAAAQSAAVMVLPVSGDVGRRFDGGRWAVIRPDGSLLVVAHNDSVIVYELATGRHLQKFAAGGKPVSTCALSPDGKRLATAGTDSTLRIWDAQSGKPVGAPQPFPQQVNSLHYFADGRLLVSQRDESRILDPEAGAELARIPVGSHGTDRMAISPDDRLVASAAPDGTIKVWDVKTSQEEFALRGHPPFLEGLAFSRDSRQLISVGSDSVIRVWELSAPRDSRVISRARPFGGVAMGSDGRRIAIALNGAALQNNEKERVQILDTKSGRELLRLDGLGNPCFGPGDRWLATNRADGSVSLWDPESGRELRNLTAEGHGSLCIAVNSDGSRMACGTAAGKVLVWDLTTGAPPQILGGHAALVTSLAFSSDGRTLASGDLHGTVIIWNESLTEVRRWQIGSALQVLAFSPTSHQLATAGESSTIAIWDFAAGTEVRTLHGHTGGVTTVAFTPDGARLVSGGIDETVRLWDAASGTEVLSLPGARGIVGYVAVSPDGRRILACESVIRVWEID